MILALCKLSRLELAGWRRDVGQVTQCHNAYNRAVGRPVPLLLVGAIVRAVIPAAPCDPISRPPEKRDCVWPSLASQYPWRGASGDTDTSVVLDGPSKAGGIVGKLPRIADLGPNRDEHAESLFGKIEVL